MIGTPRKSKNGVLVGDGGLIALMGDLAGANPPGGRLARIFLADFARREPALLEHGDVAGLARGRGGDDARVVLGDELQRVDEAVAEIVGEGDLIGGDDRAVGVLDADIALGRERVRAAIVDHLIGQQRVVAVVELDVALGGDLGVVVVVDHLVGLQQHGLRRVDFRRLDDLLERGLGLAEGRLPGGEADAKRRQNAGQ